MVAQSLVALAVAAGFVSQGGEGFRISRKQSRETQNETTTSSGVRWEQVRASGPRGRIPAASVSCGGHMYIFGGETDGKGDHPWTLNEFLDDFWRFTPRGSSGTWKELAKGPQKRISSSLVCTKGKLILYGGDERMDPVSTVRHGDVWSYDIASGRWSELDGSGGPGALAGHTAIVTDVDQDSMVLWGGQNDGDVANSQVWVYSVSKGSWTKPSRSGYTPPARSFHTAAAVPNTPSFIIFGGTTDTGVWQYDVEANHWSYAGYAPTFSIGRMSTYLDGKVFGFGGFNLKGLTTVTYNSDLLVQYSKWGGFEKLPVLSQARPDGRCYAAVTSIDGSLYIYGGFRRSASVQRLPDVWRATIE